MPYSLTLPSIPSELSKHSTNRQQELDAGRRLAESASFSPSIEAGRRFVRNSGFHRHSHCSTIQAIRGHLHLVGRSSVFQQPLTASRFFLSVPYSCWPGNRASGTTSMLPCLRSACSLLLTTSSGLCCPCGTRSWSLDCKGLLGTYSTRSCAIQFCP